MLRQSPDHRIGDRRPQRKRGDRQEDVVDAKDEESERHQTRWSHPIDEAIEEDGKPEAQAIGTGDEPAEPGARMMQVTHMIAEERIGLVEADHEDESGDERQADALHGQRLPIGYRPRCRS